MEQPPILQAEPEPSQKAALGRIGLYLSLAPLLALGVMLLFHPG